jgi:hypothetical protein
MLDRKLVVTSVWPKFEVLAAVFAVPAAALEHVQSDYGRHRPLFLRVATVQHMGNADLQGLSYVWSLDCAVADFPPRPAYVLRCLAAGLAAEQIWVPSLKQAVTVCARNHNPDLPWPKNPKGLLRTEHLNFQR